jgi:hypothetical protein
MIRFPCMCSVQHTYMHMHTGLYVFQILLSLSRNRIQIATILKYKISMLFPDNVMFFRNGALVFDPNLILCTYRKMNQLFTKTGLAFNLHLSIYDSAYRKKSASFERAYNFCLEVQLSSRVLYRYTYNKYIYYSAKYMDIQ